MIKNHSIDGNDNCHEQSVALISGAQRDLALDPRPDFLAYKIVRWCTRANGGDLDQVYALLHMQIPGSASIFSSHTGEKVLPARDGLIDAQKYCTNHLRVIGVQFFGALKPVTRALVDFQMSRGYLLSGFSGDVRYQYELERDHYEPRAGQRGMACGSGLHFFCDIDSALDYGGYHERKNWSTEPVVARRLKHGRGLVYPIIDWSALSAYGNESHRRWLQVAEVDFVDDDRPRFDWKAPYRVLSFIDRLARSAAQVVNDSSTASTKDFSTKDSTIESSDADSEADRECPVCFDEDQVLLALPCHSKHRFCRLCIDSFRVCPICMYAFK